MEEDIENVAKWNNWIEKAERPPTELPTPDCDRLDGLLFDVVKNNIVSVAEIGNNPFAILAENYTSKSEVNVSFDTLNNFERKYLHYRCDQLGLIHRSEDDESTQKRILTIICPATWKLVEPKYVKPKEKQCYKCKTTVPHNIIIPICRTCAFCKLCRAHGTHLFTTQDRMGPYCSGCIANNPNIQKLPLVPLY